MTQRRKSTRRISAAKKAAYRLDLETSADTILFRIAPDFYAKAEDCEVLESKGLVKYFDAESNCAVVNVKTRRVYFVPKTTTEVPPDDEVMVKTHHNCRCSVEKVEP